MSSIPQLDLVVHRPDGHLVAIIEIKNREGLTSELATVLRRNMIVHGNLPVVPYFLLVSQERGFLWKEADPSRFDQPPQYEFAMENVMKRYSLPHMAERLRGSELEQIVKSWLNDVDQSGFASDEPERSLAKSGFLDAIRGASLARGAA